MSIFAGTVFYPTSTPYQGKFGPSYNIAVKFDGSAPVPASQLNKQYANDGAVRVYHNADTKEADYMRTLKTEDAVTCLWLEDKDKYMAIVPNDFKAPQPQAQPQTVAKSDAWTPMTDGEMEAWRAIVLDENEKLLVCYTYAKAGLPDASLDNLLRVAISLYIAGQRVFKPGMTLATEPQNYDAELLSLVDPDNQVDTLLDAISIMHDAFPDREAVISLLRLLGKGSKDIDGQESWLSLWHMAQFYGDMVVDGSPTEVAVSATKDKFNIKDEIPF